MDSALRQTKSLRAHPLGAPIVRVLEAALQAVDPYQTVRNNVEWCSDGVRIANARYPLPPGGRIFVMGAGKAGLAMARALVDVLDAHIDAGIVAIKGASDHEPFSVGPIRILPSAHPVPDGRSVAAGRGLLELARRAGPRDLVLCPISGGASSLSSAPHADLTLDDLALVTKGLLRSGADIHALNTVRKHLDAIKGGGLALATGEATVVSLVLSDVIGDPLDIIASGPTFGDRSTFEDAWDILHAAMDASSIPPRVLRWLAAGCRKEHPDTPDPDDPRLGRVHHVILASNATAIAAATHRARALGIGVIGQHELVGEASEAGRELARRFDELPSDHDACIVAGGETTVTIRGEGVGGRNLEVALAGVGELSQASGSLLVTLATDGDDGPTGAAGAVVTEQTRARALERHLDPADFLARNDSLRFFEALDDVIRTGPTGTNVCDLAILARSPIR